ncbi:MAG: hypothetical protein V2A73_08650 [Pseudomonadota bacterium]
MVDATLKQLVAEIVTLSQIVTEQRQKIAALEKENAALRTAAKELEAGKA